MFSFDGQQKQSRYDTVIADSFIPGATGHARFRSRAGHTNPAFCYHILLNTSREQYEGMTEWCDRDEPPDCNGVSGQLFRSIPDPTLEYTVEEGVATVRAGNAAYRERFEPADQPADGPTELAARLASDLGEESNDTVETVARAAADGESVRTVVRVGAGDTSRDYLVRVVPAEAESAEGFVVLTEVTPERGRIRELEAERDRLDEFASIVSHDLRGPLDVANAHLEAAEARGDEVHFRKIEGVHERIRRIVEEVLDLARRGRIIDEVEPVALGQVAEAAWGSVPTADASLVVTTDCTVEADASRLQQLLENLFRNAIEHGGPEVTVEVGTTGDGFYVVDDGPGIPADRRERIFEPDVSGSESGSGLGLFVVRRIAEAHGWSVGATDSETDLDTTDPETDRDGARFEFTDVSLGEER